MSTDKKTIDWYNNNADKFTSHVRNPKDSVYHAYYEKPAMYSLIPDIKNKSVLSLGCGSGEDSAYLKNLGANKSVGIDISSELIKIAKESHQGCRFEVMDMGHLNFPDSSFDFVYSSLAIHHIENWAKTFKEVYRVLKPNSYFLFSCGHPVKYAMEVLDTETHRISKLEISRNKETKEITIVGDYLNKTKYIDELGKDTVNSWHKSFSEIASELFSAGFLIEQIVEPRPLKKLEEISPETYKRLMKIPEFVIFRLLKPNN